MIGLDTNVLVRYLTQDDAVQARKASALIESLTEERPGFVTLVALTELVWVLQGCYQASNQDVVRVVETLRQVRTLVIEGVEIVSQAMSVFSAVKADFADCLIEKSAYAAGCSHTVTFDRKAASKLPGMHLIK
jgi:predicted nucleic-acid-binding protein